MRPIEFIRRNVFSASQIEFGSIAKATQSTVSRWESGDAKPDAEHMQNIRAEAAKRRIAWSDAWFFEAPALPAKPAPAPEMVGDAA